MKNNLWTRRLIYKFKNTSSARCLPSSLFTQSKISISDKVYNQKLSLLFLLNQGLLNVHYFQMLINYSNFLLSRAFDCLPCFKRRKYFIHNVYKFLTIKKLACNSAFKIDLTINLQYFKYLIAILSMVITS